MFDKLRIWIAKRIVPKGVHVITFPYANIIQIPTPTSVKPVDRKKVKKYINRRKRK